MKKTIAALFVLAMLLSFTVTVSAESLPLFEIKGNTISLRDDGTNQAFPVLNFWTTDLGAVAEASGLRLAIDAVSISEIKAATDSIATEYNMRLGDMGLLIKLNVTFTNNGEKDIIFRPSSVLLVTFSGEQVGVLVNKTTAFQPDFLSGSSQSGTLVFKCESTKPEDITGFRLRFPFPADESMTPLEERIDLQFTLDREYLIAGDPALTENQQLAAWRARHYYRNSSLSMSRANMISTIAAVYGEEDATVGVDYLNIDWNEVALNRARNYMQQYATSSNDRDAMVYLLTEIAKFTPDEATYAVNVLGLH